MGTFSGCGFLAEATALTGFILAANTLLRLLVNYINRRLIDASATEAQYAIHALCDPANVSDVRDLLFAKLEAAHYPIREIVWPIAPHIPASFRSARDELKF